MKSPCLPIPQSAAKTWKKPKRNKRAKRLKQRCAIRGQSLNMQRSPLSLKRPLHSWRQYVSYGAGLGAIVLAWILTFAGMCALANAFRLLACLRPDLKAGIYAYAREGFGPLAGFEIAWGYWLSAVFGNVAFAVLIQRTARYFFPALEDHAAL